MLTYQDFLNAPDKENFILHAISQYKLSRTYNWAFIASEYYHRRNIEIMKRNEKLLSTGERSRLNKPVRRPVNRKCCGFFSKSVNQLSMYLLGNGVTLPGEAKLRLGKNFDSKLQIIGRQALIDGVCWAYLSLDNVIPLKAREFFTLKDEKTSQNMVGIRFYRIDDNKPMFVELYELDGITAYKEINGKLILDSPKAPYIQGRFVDALTTRHTASRNYNALPVIPFFANDSAESLLTEGLKNDIDLYDRIMSDFGDNLDRSNDIYYVIQNYGGANLSQLINEIEEYRAIYTDGDNAGAEIRTLEVPHEARKTALQLLEKQMYKETQTLNTEELTGGNLTNVAIKAALIELDFKADFLEWQADAFVSSLLNLTGLEIDNSDIEFKRRTLINDSEIIQNIYAMRGDIDQKTALMLNPYISEKIAEDILTSI